MASLNMRGPFALSIDSINKHVTEVSCGNYALGYIDNRRAFVVLYVGRSDTDVADRLKQHVGMLYKYFKYSYASSPKEAFEKECNNFHSFGEVRLLDNSVHPRRPDNCDWKCPICDAIG